MALRYEPTHDFLPHDAEYGLDKESLSRSQIIHPSFGRQFWIPQFATNPEQLRSVIAKRLWAFAHSTAPMPKNVTSVQLDNDCAMAVLRQLMKNPASRKSREMQAALAKYGSLGNLLAKIAWACWRATPRLSNKEIAEEIGMSKSQIVSHLSRLIRTAQALGFPVYPQRHKNLGQRRKRRPIDARSILRLWHAGQNVPTIATELGISEWRTRRTLRENGIILSLSESKRRCWRSADYRKNHAAGMSAAWQNPKTRPALLTQIKAVHAKRKSNAASA